MYTSYNSSLEKNQMITPPLIGLTSSIVNDKLSNISLEDNSTGLFKIDNSTIKPIVEMPIETNNFIISGTNDEIDSNENNAVNKRYLSNKIGNLDDKYMKKDVKSLNLNELNINTTKEPFKINTELKSGILNPYLNFTYGESNSSKIMSLHKTMIFTNVSIGAVDGISFNVRDNFGTNIGGLPMTYLRGLVPSNITTNQLSTYSSYNYNDKICPTYQFTENTYAKKSEVSTNLAWNSFSVYTTDGDDFKKQLSNISIKIAGSHITIPIPTDINSTNLIMSVDFTVRSTNKTALNALGCTLNSLSGSSTSLSETETRASVFSGYTTKGTCIRTNSPYEYKFSLICPFSTTRHKKAYLHFFFDDSVNYTANDEIYILATKTEPQVNVTIFGI